MFLNLVCWIVVGLVAGLIAGKFVNQRGDDPKLALATAALGAVLCGFIFGRFSKVGVNEFNLSSLWLAAVGAAAVLVGWHLFRGLASRA
jgi:uncharacterized membrane protein YeaQ/YmgE (transglycosylase-associated protein family)